jgi:hypothetical protein
LGLSIGEKCGNVLPRPCKTVSSTATLRRWYLVDFILDDVAQLRPLHAVIAYQSVRPDL